MRSVYLDLLFFLRKNGFKKLTNILLVKHNFYQANLAHIALSKRDDELIELSIRNNINFNQQDKYKKTPLDYFFLNKFEEKDISLLINKVNEIELKIGNKLLSRDCYTGWDALSYCFNNFEEDIETKKTKDFANLFIFLLERVKNKELIDNDLFIEMISYGNINVLLFLDAFLDEQMLARTIHASLNKFLVVKKSFREFFNQEDEERVLSFLLGCKNFNDNVITKDYCEWYELYEVENHSLQDVLDKKWSMDCNPSYIEVLRNLLSIKKEKESLDKFFATPSKNNKVKI